MTIDNIYDLQYLIFSSHKTSNNTLNETFLRNEIKSHFIHTLEHLELYYNIKNNRDDFKYMLYEYVNIHKKKLNIITIIRNPYDRLLSSFFQYYHDNCVEFLNVDPNLTTIMKSSYNELYTIYKEYIDIYTTHFNKETWIHNHESLYELSEIFNEDIISNLVNKDNYYYYENEYMNLYVLDFNKIHDIKYINTIFSLHMNTIYSSNLTSEKIFYTIYLGFKKFLKENDSENISEKIKEKYKDNTQFFYNFIL